MRQYSVQPWVRLFVKSWGIFLIAKNIDKNITAWKMFKYGVISGPYFPVFSPNTGKYGLEITLYLETFHAVYKNISKNLSRKYIQKLLDHAKSSATDALEIASKRTIKKAGEATADLLGNKILDKISQFSRNS